MVKKKSSEFYKSFQRALNCYVVFWEISQFKVLFLMIFVKNSQIYKLTKLFVFLSRYWHYFLRHPNFTSTLRAVTTTLPTVAEFPQNFRAYCYA